MEKTNQMNGASLYRSIFLVSLIALLLMAIKVNLHGFTIFDVDGTATMASGANLKNNHVGVAINGKCYDNEEAVIYKGDSYKDSTKMAKKVRKYIRPYMKKSGYAQYTDVIVAMCAQESRFGSGDRRNWMQVKGYRGAAGMESVKAGADHFIKLVKKAEKLHCTDMTVIIQAYNFGTGYIDYCMEQGGKDTLAIRTKFQVKQRSKLGVRTYGDFSYAERIERRIKVKKKK